MNSLVDDQELLTHLEEISDSLKELVKLKRKEVYGMDYADPSEVSSSTKKAVDMKKTVVVANQSGEDDYRPVKPKRPANNKQKEKR